MRNFVLKFMKYLFGIPVLIVAVLGGIAQWNTNPTFRYIVILFVLVALAGQVYLALVDEY